MSERNGRARRESYGFALPGKFRFAGEMAFAGGAEKKPAA